MRIQTILACTDFSPASEHAVRRAVWLARDLGAQLALAHAIPANLFEMIDTFWHEVNAPPSAADSLSCLAASIREETGVAPSLHIPAGKTVPALSALARQLDADLVVVGARGEHALRDILFGSTASRLLRACPRPLLVVKRPPEVAYHHPMVGMDSDESACRVLRTVHALAPDAVIQAVHAFEPPMISLLERAQLSAERMNVYVREAGENARRSMNVALAGCAVPTKAVSPVFIHGAPPEVLHAHALETGADLVAVGRNEADGADDIWLGSVSKHVVYEAECDVLAVPPGNQSRA